MHFPDCVNCIKSTTSHCLAAKQPHLGTNTSHILNSHRRRGLTPPHRVKSISMATFSPEEIDFISARGNEYCRKVWLGLCDQEQLSKDEQQIKDFMISKYERKRYYVKAAENEFLVQNGNGSKNSNINSSMNTPIPKISPLSSNLSYMTNGGSGLNNNTISKISKNNNLSPTGKNDLQNGSSFIDPFSPISFNQSSAPVNHFSTEPMLPDQQQTTDFANFDNNPVFSNTSQTGWWDFNQIQSGIEMSGLSYNTWGTTHTISNYDTLYLNSTAVNSFDKCPPPPSEDRYAALKALDSLMKSQVMETASTQQTQASSNDWGSTFMWPGASTCEVSNEDVNNQSSNNMCNPFSSNFENGWKSTQHFVGNPFKTEISWSTNNVSNGFINQPFDTTKPIWETQLLNPFTVGSNGQTSTHHSNNPFL
ncbi:arf-GAP domain and FG repeat-containing protein 1 isoform X2 [Cimex lectularius]|uniref:Arf-GAP domain-containing protein n=1 Tax=Cimex lectularius TaxID=79782 RepID=A0A8I6RMK8_CIMLE|nr:arf-GAP domain and FG repeat-containing protein 1 isoform X2 [Cimex lectularius]